MAALLATFKSIKNKLFNCLSNQMTIFPFIVRQPLATLLAAPSFFKYLNYYHSLQYDSHWLPYWLHCSPCAVNYDAVIKVESMDRDFKYLQKKVPILRRVELTRLQVGLEVQRENEEVIVQAHLMQLSKKEFKELFKRYKFDFMLFGYHPVRLQ